MNCRFFEGTFFLNKDLLLIQFLQKLVANKSKLMRKFIELSIKQLTKDQVIPTCTF